MLKKRIFTALIFIPVFLFFLSKELLFFFFIILASGIGLFEFYKISKTNFSFQLTGIIIGLILTGSFYFLSFPHLFFLLFSGLLVFFVLQIFQKNNEKIETDSLLKAVFGLIYVAFLFGFLIKLRIRPEGEKYILFLFLGTWGTDTGAYFLGKYFGRHKLLPQISAKKTVEGLVGGFLGGIIAMILANGWLDLFPLPECFILAFVIGFLAQIGDLSESVLKRSFSVKDSGKFLPGHGGILDVADSLLFTSPGLYYYLILKTLL
jgi:phosphatidate cytidylyltransferase